MKEMSKREKEAFLKKLEKVRRDLETSSFSELAKKVDDVIKMFGDEWNGDDRERDRAVNEVLELAREAFCIEVKQLKHPTESPRPP